MSLDSVEKLLRHVSGNPEAMAKLAVALLAKGRDEQARELCAQAVAMAPHSAEVHSLVQEVRSYGVPEWFFKMVTDHERHSAYEKAMEMGLQPGDHVLDIGTGTGLFAMMAARAGAARVVTCEENAAVAEVASEIIERNGFSDRVQVVPKRLQELEVGADLERPVDAVIIDNLSNNVIGAGVLPAVEQATRRLARPDALVIPFGGVIRVALAEVEDLISRPMEEVEGFDLSPFNQLAPPRYPIRVGSERLQLRSPPGDLFSFDFRGGGPYPEGRAKLDLISSGGTVNGVVQWNRFHIYNEMSYENYPAAGTSSAFDAMFFPLIEPFKSNSGDTVCVCGAHDRLSTRIWVQA